MIVVQMIICRRQNDKFENVACKVAPIMSRS